MSTAPDHRPGDIVMFANSADCVGRLIQELDASPYSHSGLAVGDDELSHITGSGSELSTISQRCTDTGIYHLITTHGVRGELTEEQRAAICAEGRRLAALELDYGNVQVVLAGLLLLTRRIPTSIRPVVAPVLWVFSKVVDDLGNAARGGDDTMICSDYVYRCYRAGGVELLPDGVPDLPHDDEPTLDEWLGDRPATVAGAPLPELPAELTGDPLAGPGDSLGGPLGGGSLLDRLCDAVERRRRARPADLALRDATTIDEIREARAAAHQALRTALGPRPDGAPVADFVTPGDLLRGGTVTERDRWTR